MTAAESAYAGGEGWLNDCVAYISDNHDFANAYIKKNIPMMKVGQTPQGTYLVWVDVTAIADKIGAKKMADDANQTAHDAAAKMGTDYSGRQAMAAMRVADAGRHGPALDGEECLRAAQCGQHLWLGRRQPHAHEHRHLSQDS